jgi:hypothetical protein
MEQLVATNASKLKKMGDAAFDRVKQRHDIDTEAAKLLVLFNEGIQ